MITTNIEQGRGQVRVAVVIVNFNGGPLLKLCLDSLHAQTRSPARIIVVDNASVDESCTGLGDHYPQVTLIRSETNLGFAAANNLAVKQAADCDWIALLNPDARAEPSWLEELLSAALRQPEYAFFGCRMLLADTPQLLDGVGDAYHVTGLVWREAHGKKAQGVHLVPREIFSPCGAAALYRSDAFLDADGFDERYFCYVEDVDLGFRLRLLGYRCLYVPNAVVHHKGSAITGKHSDFAIYHGHRNTAWTFIKDFPSPWIWIALPGHMLMTAIVVAIFMLRGQAAVIVRAKYHAALGIPAMWRSRKHIQTRRRVQAMEIISLMRFSLRRK